MCAFATSATDDNLFYDMTAYLSTVDPVHALPSLLHVVVVQAGRGMRRVAKLGSAGM